MVSSHVTIRTSFGGLIGSEITVNDRINVNQFLGIPYAKPPINDLRFKKTVSIDKFDPDPFEATKLPPACPYPYPVEDDSESEEDCLYLNIWTPNIDPEEYDMDEIQDLRSVMVYIQGNPIAPNTGPNKVDGSILAAYTDVVVVTLNYRSGHLGFLYTGDNMEHDAPGNMGLWDILTALKVVKDVIKAFGGDNEDITLFGDSSSGQILSLISISPKSQTLFNKVIITGSVLDVGHSMYDKTTAHSVALEIAHSICPGTHYEDKLIRQCFIDADIRSLQNLIKGHNMTRDDLDYEPRPVFGDELIPDDPRIQMKSYPTGKRVLQVGLDFMDGQTLYQNGLLEDNSVVDRFRDSGDQEEWKNGFIHYIKSEILDIFHDDLNVLMREYFTQEKFDDHNQTVWMSQLADFYGDLNFYCPAVIQIDQLTDLNDVYIYVYKSIVIESQLDTVRKRCNSLKPASCLINDYEIILGHPLVNSGQYSYEAKRVSDEVINTFSDFSKHEKAAEIKFNEYTKLYEFNLQSGDSSWASKKKVKCGTLRTYILPELPTFEETSREEVPEATWLTGMEALDDWLPFSILFGLINFLAIAFIALSQYGSWMLEFNQASYEMLFDFID